MRKGSPEVPHGPPEVPQRFHGRFHGGSIPEPGRFHGGSSYYGPLAPEVPHRFLQKTTPRNRLQKTVIRENLGGTSGRTPPMQEEPPVEPPECRNPACVEPLWHLPRILEVPHFQKVEPLFWGSSISVEPLWHLPWNTIWTRMEAPLCTPNPAHTDAKFLEQCSEQACADM